MAEGTRSTSYSHTCLYLLTVCARSTVLVYLLLHTELLALPGTHGIIYFRIHRGGGLLDVLILQIQAHILVSTERTLLQSALQVLPFAYGFIFPHPSKWRLTKHNYPSYRFRHMSSYPLSVYSFRVPYKCY